MKQNKKYAITGGIGSGKSTVCEILKKKGYPVFSCDGISRELWLSTEYRAGLAELLPECTENGEIDKKKLSSLVFQEKSLLERLNAFSHARILTELFRRMEGHEIAFAEVPLLFEEKLEKQFDGVLAVRRDERARIRAVISRDGISKEDVLLRISNQFLPSCYEEMNCFILENNGSLQQLEEGVDSFLQSVTKF